MPDFCVPAQGYHLDPLRGNPPGRSATVLAVSIGVADLVADDLPVSV